MKKISLYCFVFVVVILVTLCGCSPNVIGNPKNEQKNKEPSIDLSEYDSHGSWSCDRIWVKKTESSWDKANSYIGYLDENGEVIGSWHPISSWETPYDFVNDFAFIGKGVHEFSWNSARIASFDIINKNGKVIFSIDTICNSKKYDGAAFMQFNKHGYAFYIPAYYEDTYVKSGNATILTSEGRSIELDDRIKVNDLNGFQGYFSEGYMYFCDLGIHSYYFNEKGKIALDFSDLLENYLGERYNIKRLYPIENQMAKVVFEGKDEKNYFIVVDIYGNLLTPKPVPVNQIDTFDYDSLDKVDNSRVSSINNNDLQLGSIVKFGNYEQDNIPSNGAELIEWIVLEKSNGHALLFSKNVLDSHAFLGDRLTSTTTWENSDVREWLNSTFYSTAFNNTEKSMIQNSDITSNDITYTGTYNNSTMDVDYARTIESIVTSDKVFLLSCKEINEYLSEEDLLGKSTKTLKGNESMRKTYAGDVDYYCWMTRDVVAQKSSISAFSKQPIFVWGATGTLENYLEWEMDYSFESGLYCGVRPALWITIN